jgi:hypothetical protein
MYRFHKICFLRCLDDLHFKSIFHKQSGSGSRAQSRSEIKVKVGSGSEKTKKNYFGSTTLIILFKDKENPGDVLGHLIGHHLRDRALGIYSDFKHVHLHTCQLCHAEVGTHLPSLSVRI